MFNDPYEEYYTVPKNSFATASIVLGALSVFMASTIYLGLICGALAAIFAILSRRGTGALSPKALVGLIAGLISIAFSIIMVVTAIKNLPTLLNDPMFREEAKRILEMFYGDSIDYDLFFESFTKSLPAL